jgi:DNA-binding NarL/FixJ family response regulator
MSRILKKTLIVPTKSEIRVMLVDDDEFSLAILGDSMKQWSNVLCVSSVSEAIGQLEAFDPNVVVTDLNFRGGPDGSQLLGHLTANFPWIGRVVLTSHASPSLALGKESSIPEGTLYLVKADVSGSAVLQAAVLKAIEGRLSFDDVEPAQINHRATISRSQAEVLKLIAEGKSNSAIAKALDISLRAAESLVQRTLAALDLKNDEDHNLRVLATRMWIEGKVTTK